MYNKDPYRFVHLCWIIWISTAIICFASPYLTLSHGAANTFISVQYKAVRVALDIGRMNGKLKQPLPSLGISKQAQTTTLKYLFLKKSNLLLTLTARRLDIWTIY